MNPDGSTRPTQSNNDDEGRIEELKKGLYSRSTPDIRTKRKFRFSRPDVSALKTDWEHPQEENEEVQLNKRYKDHSMSFFTKLFIGSLVFFLIAVGIGTYLVLNGSNIVSANNIDITIDGPVSIAGGSPLSFNVQVTNKNNIKLQNVDLEVDFPDGTVDPTDTTKPLTKFQQLMDDIQPGGVSQKSVNAILYGQENSQKEIDVNVSYQVAGSNAIFQKEKTFDIILTSSPLSLSIDSFKEITSGQSFTMGVTLTSNSSDVLKNLILKGTYPFGYTYTSSDTKTTGDNATWNVGNLAPGAKKTINITGSLTGQDGENRVFTFAAGALDTSGQTTVQNIGTEYVSDTQQIAIQKPFITVGIGLNKDTNTGDYVNPPNTPITTDITYFNNLPTAITDAEIDVKFAGNVFDKTLVTPQNGVYQSASNEIVWNKITSPELANIAPGQSGTITFSFTPHDPNSSYSPVTNPNVGITVDVSGKRNSETNVPESITSSATRNIKLSSNLTLSSQVVRSTGPFVNSGPIPPIAEQPTTYTILWTVDNTSNTVSGAEVDASLPAGINWVGNTSPSSENITYSSNTGKIAWKIGSLPTYTQANQHERQVAFQVSLTPSVVQVGAAPTIVNQAVLTAQDDYTSQTLSSSQDVLNTRFSTDPTFKDGDETVGN